MIRNMQPSDWSRVAEIYTQSILSGHATFTDTCPSFAEWDHFYCPDCRFVFEQDGQVVGWVAVHPVSTRPAYRGLVEVSIYIDQAYRHRGIGTQLLLTLCSESERAGYWCLYASVFAVNDASLALHKKCGFRVIGYREKPAKDRFGVWQDTVLFERRSQKIL